MSTDLTPRQSDVWSHGAPKAPDVRLRIREACDLALRHINDVLRPSAEHCHLHSKEPQKSLLFSSDFPFSMLRCPIKPSGHAGHVCVQSNEVGADKFKHSFNTQVCNVDAILSDYHDVAATRRRDGIDDTTSFPRHKTSPQPKFNTLFNQVPHGSV